MNKKELIAEAEKRGIKVPSSAIKAEITKMIDDFDAEKAADTALEKELEKSNDSYDIIIDDDDDVNDDDVNDDDLNDDDDDDDYDDDGNSLALQEEGVFPIHTYDDLTEELKTTYFKFRNPKGLIRVEGVFPIHTYDDLTEELKTTYFKFRNPKGLIRVEGGKVLPIEEILNLAQIKGYKSPEKRLAHFPYLKKVNKEKAINYLQRWAKLKISAIQELYED